MSSRFFTKPLVAAKAFIAAHPASSVALGIASESVVHVLTPALAPLATNLIVNPLLARVGASLASASSAASTVATRSAKVAVATTLVAATAALAYQIITDTPEHITKPRYVGSITGMDHLLAPAAEDEYIPVKQEIEPEVIKSVSEVPDPTHELSKSGLKLNIQHTAKHTEITNVGNTNIAIDAKSGDLASTSSSSSCSSTADDAHKALSMTFSDMSELNLALEDVDAGPLEGPANVCNSVFDMRHARFCGRMVRLEMSYPRYSAANRAIANTRLLAMLKEKNVRNIDILRCMPSALVAVFTPTREEIDAKLEMASIEAAEQRLRASEPVWQRQDIGPQWLHNALPVPVAHLLSKWVRTDMQPSD